jgi:hypothetical protein
MTSFSWETADGVWTFERDPKHPSYWLRTSPQGHRNYVSVQLVLDALLYQLSISTCTDIIVTNPVLP